VGGETTARRATLAAVAREAGVSVSTVSKVVNGRTDVAPETRARIGALLATHSYVARGSAQSAVRTVDLTFDAMQTPNNLEIIRGAIETAAADDVDVVVGQIPDDPTGATWARRVALSQRAGMILVTSSINDQQWGQFLHWNIPVVTIDPVNIPTRDIPSVGATNFNGGMEATAHLVGLGHRHIGFIEGPPDAMVSLARLHGYRAALSQAGLTSDGELMRAAAAFGALEAARTLGLRVPQDVSVVGFDDMPAAQWSAPPLTTVRQPFAEMGRVAMRRLLRRIAGEHLVSPRVELATRLVVRKSTAAI
jgi:LacI family transcriptional regulator